MDCPIKSNFGIPCPGCGFQRSIGAILNGDFVTSFQYYPALFPILVLFVYTGLHLKFDYKYGARTIIILFCLSIFLANASYVMALCGIWFIK
ncbi:MAG: DUF2752 domain-containing protein [Bacteroidota bacterium]